MGVTNFGINVSDANVLIGGTTAAARNVIANGLDDGLSVIGTTATNVVIKGNYIGTNATGTVAVGSPVGVLISNSQGVLIGGLVAAKGNFVSGNTTSIEITGAGATGTIVEGNLIGTDLTGTLALGNTTAGIEVDTSTSANTIGGIVAGAGNLISGNNTTNAIGVELTGTGTSTNLIEGNVIGLSSVGTALGNYIGVEVTAGAINNTIGGLTSTPGTGAGNVISANETGVYIQGVGLSGILVAGNLIGTNETGKSVVGTQLDGIYSNGNNDTIGGITASARNIISEGPGIGNGIQIQGNDNLSRATTSAPTLTAPLRWATSTTSSSMDRIIRSAA